VLEDAVTNKLRKVVKFLRSTETPLAWRKSSNPLRGRREKMGDGESLHWAPANGRKDRTRLGLAGTLFSQAMNKMHLPHGAQTVKEERNRNWEEVIT